MGIPSYYKRLIDSVPGLILKRNPGSIQWLWMDFNCLIYHCLHRADTPKYLGTVEKEQWESEFLNCVTNYCMKVVKEVAPSKGVRVCIDGVVPMAKMKQQRLRRFKSAWLTKQETSGEEKWDTNSITPGTAFMGKLRNRLEQMAAKHTQYKWNISSADEPGEGEHKILDDWATGAFKENCAIYGLDADLIVLSLLGKELFDIPNIWLFREEVNAGKMSYDAMGEEIFEWFSLQGLRDYIIREVSDPSQFIQDYCFAMSILGNDFLPSSLGLKIRDDGHSELVDILKRMHGGGEYLISEGNIHIQGLLRLFEILSQNEEYRIQKFIRKKYSMATNLGYTTNDVDIPVGDNNWPLAHVEEMILMENKTLVSDWEKRYLEQWFPGMVYDKQSIHKICKEYLFGIQWIWSYYKHDAKETCYNWFYPYSLPPLWKWLKEYIQTTGLPSFPGRIYLTSDDIRPVEQLSLVLPLESWGLIPNGKEKYLPQYAPYLFPSEFTFEHVGKRYFWECESMIPIPSILEIKQIIQSHT
jgi:5'-3' exonuclease